MTPLRLFQAAMTPSRHFLFLAITLATALPALAQVEPKERLVPKAPKLSRVQADLQAISAAIQTYRINAGHYPTQAQGLQALVEKPTKEPIPNRWVKVMSKVPLDPWGNPYVLATRKKEKDDKEEHYLFSNGPDKSDAKDDIERVLPPIPEPEPEAQPPPVIEE